MSRAKKTPFFPEHLKAVLQDLKYPHSEFATDIGITPTHFSRILKSGKITVLLLDRISVLLDLRPDFFTTKDWIDYYFDDPILSRQAWEFEQIKKRRDCIMEDFFSLLQLSATNSDHYRSLNERERNAFISTLRTVADYLLFEGSDKRRIKKMKAALDTLKKSFL